MVWTGDKDAQIVVYGHGVAQPLEISPPLLAAWGGRIVGFNIARWVHALSGNAKKMMAVRENAPGRGKVEDMQTDKSEIGDRSVQATAEGAIHF